MVNKTNISIVIPIFNEEESIAKLVDEVLTAMRLYRESFEIIIVNDGSEDRSAEVLERLSKTIPELVCILLRKNYGQTAAMAAGFDESNGDIIVSLDGDLQNNPADIPLLIDKLKEGYDLVSGWRYNRKDSEISRNLSKSRWMSYHKWSLY